MRKPATVMRKDHLERGNALFMILLGVLLFAALTYAVQQGFRGGNERLSGTRIEALADDIIMTAAGYEKAVNKMINNGISENRISFTRASGDGYDLTPASAATEQVFSISGGGANYLSPANDMLDTSRSGQSDYGSWLFIDDMNVYGLYDLYNSNVLIDGVNRGDLIAILPYVRREICARINTRLGISNQSSGAPPQEGDNIYLSAKANGTFTMIRNINTSGIISTNTFYGRKAGCFQGNQDNSNVDISANYYFYYVLLAR